MHDMGIERNDRAADRRGRFGRGLASSSAALALAASAAHAGPGAVEAIVVEGEPAPGTDRTFQRFDRPAPAFAGFVAFTGDLDGATDRDDVVYLGGALLAREGDVAPGTGGLRYDDFASFDGDEAAQADGGAVVFVASLEDAAPGTDEALFRASFTGTTELVARTGDPAAVAPGRTWTGFAQAGLLPDGRTGYVGDLDGSTSDDAVLVLDGAVVLREGGALPGLDGVTIDGGFEEVQWTADGSILLEVNSSLPSSADRLLVRLDPANGGLQVLASEGDPVVTDSGAWALGSILEAASAPGGHWAARVGLPEAGPFEDSAVIGPGGTLDHEGRGVPEIAGGILGEIVAVAVAHDGRTAYVADVSTGGTGDAQAILVDGRVAVVTGDPVPGLPEGTAFTSFGVEDVAITPDGRVVFAAAYGGGASGDGLFGFALEACPSDLDDDGTVGATDLLIVLESWGACPPAGCAADIDGDGRVGFGDVVRVAHDWGGCPD